VADPEAGIRFLKGHGTENDFVLLPDPEGALQLTEPHVRALCDRRRGIGADGVLRVVLSAALGWSADGGSAAEWFMDYRNADGSVAEMCGNGVRVFARYLAEHSLVNGDELVVGTRAGAKRVRFEPDGEITVGMGPVRLGGRSGATLGGRDFDGLVVDVGNPHLACVTDVALDELDLSRPPGYDPSVFPDGVNVEFVNPVHGGVVRMRVYERGVGETRSCGTGTVAAAASALYRDGRSEGALTVRVPGGAVQVELAGGVATLTGPAVLVASGELSAAWWRSLAPG
jgi:diaminopimelate epimerase